MTPTFLTMPKDVSEAFIARGLRFAQTAPATFNEDGDKQFEADGVSVNVGDRRVHFVFEVACIKIEAFIDDDGLVTVDYEAGVYDEYSKGELLRWHKEVTNEAREWATKG